MPSTCFETEGSSSGRRLYIHVRYSLFYMHNTSSLDFYIQESLCCACKTHSNIPIYKPSSWRWTFGFETCRRHQKLKIKILIKKRCISFFILYNVIAICSTKNIKIFCIYLKSHHIYIYIYIYIYVCVCVCMCVKDFTIIKCTGIKMVVNLLRFSGFFGHFQWLVLTHVQSYR